MSQQARVRPSWKKRPSGKQIMKRLRHKLDMLKRSSLSDRSKRSFKRQLEMGAIGLYDGG
jgi:hypothetical protein